MEISAAAKVASSLGDGEEDAQDQEDNLKRVAHSTTLPAGTLYIKVSVPLVPRP